MVKMTVEEYMKKLAKLSKKGVDVDWVKVSKRLNNLTF